MSWQRRARVRASAIRGTRVSGAALLEFLAVCVPLLTIVFNALEFARYSQVKMIARYASAQGARACSVYADHKYNPSGAAANAAAVENIVRAELSPWAGKWFQVNDIGRCNLAGGSSEDEHSPVSYQVSLGLQMLVSAQLLQGFGAGCTGQCHDGHARSALRASW